MLRHAGKLGAKVIEETKVSSLVFEGDPATTRPTAARWINTHVRAARSGSNASSMPLDAAALCPLHIEEP